MKKVVAIGLLVICFLLSAGCADGADNSDLGVYLISANGGDIAIFNEHKGGSMSGENYSTVILPDDRVKEFGFMVYAYISKDEYDIVLGQNPGLFGGSFHFEVCQAGDDRFRPLGDRNYHYGRVETRYDGGRQIRPAPDLAVIGDTAYVIAQYSGTEDGALKTPGIYSVDVKTGKTERVVEDVALRFQIKKGDIFFLGIDKQIYKVKIGDSIVKKAPNARKSDFGWEDI